MKRLLADSKQLVEDKGIFELAHWIAFCAAGDSD